MLNGRTRDSGLCPVHGKAGLAIYEIQSEGGMAGTFIDGFHDGRFGKETLTPIR